MVVVVVAVGRVTELYYTMWGNTTPYGSKLLSTPQIVATI
jgi:hypothetical protein